MTEHFNDSIWVPMKIAISVVSWSLPFYTYMTGPCDPAFCPLAPTFLWLPLLWYSLSLGKDYMGVPFMAEHSTCSWELAQPWVLSLTSIHCKRKLLYLRLWTAPVLGPYSRLQCSHCILYCCVSIILIPVADFRVETGFQLQTRTLRQVLAVSIL